MTKPISALALATLLSLSATFVTACSCTINPDTGECATAQETLKKNKEAMGYNQ